MTSWPSMMRSRPVSANTVTAPLEIQSRCVEKYRVEPAEQVASMREQLLLNQIIGASRRKLGGRVLLLSWEFLAEPGHRAVEVMQVKIVAASDAIVLAPAVGGEIRTAPHQSMQHSEKHRALQREMIPALACEAGDNVLEAGLCQDAPRATPGSGSPDFLRRSAAGE